MNYWLLSAGKDGELWPAFWANKLVAIGWSALGDLGGFESREQLKEKYLQKYRLAKAGQVRTDVTLVWSFYKGISIGDVVFVRLYTHLIGIGVVQGDYSFLSKNDGRRKQLSSPFFHDVFPHIRAVRWLSLGGGLKQPLTLTRLTLMEA